MKTATFATLALLILCPLTTSYAGTSASPATATPAVTTPASASSKCPSYLDIELKKLNSSKTVKVCDLYKANKPVLVVNTASHCGFTKQFTELEALHKKYKDQSLLVLGFPSNDFKQEEKSEAATADICYQNYGVTFAMFSHAKVKGKNADPLFKYLASQSQAPKWNFNKYLIGKNGSVTHFGSRTKPLQSELEKAIQAEL